jgi:hypothetical protein
MNTENSSFSNNFLAIPHSLEVLCFLHLDGEILSCGVEGLCPILHSVTLRCLLQISCSGNIYTLEMSRNYKYGARFYLLFFLVLGLELKAHTLSHPTTPFGDGFF